MRPVSATRLLGILRSMPLSGLRVLRVSFWSEIEDPAFFEFIAKACPALHTLEVHQYHDVQKAEDLVGDFSSTLALPPTNASPNIGNDLRCAASFG
jgi:hypothetical protein